MHSNASDASVGHRLPPWLLIAVAVLLTQLLVSVVLDPQPRDLIPTAVGIALAGFLIWGSRAAWVVVILGTLYQIGSSLHSSQWHLAAGLAVALCLLAPSSIRYVWMTRAQQPPRWIGQRTMELYVQIRTATYAFAYRLIAWDEGDEDQGDPVRQRSYRAGLGRFGIACLVLLLLGGATVNWQESIDGGSTVLAVVGDIIWICYVFAQLTFVALVVLALRGVAVKSRLHGRQQQTKGHRMP